MASPVLIAVTVQSSAARQAAVVAAVAGTLPAPLAPSSREALREEWYTLILSGFNTIDDACMTYIDDLWILERRKTRTSTILAVTGAAGAALLGSLQPTPSVAAGLVVLAQAFGLATAISNAVADSYLYTQNAATIKKLVQITTVKYRTDFASKVRGQDEVTYPLASPGATYHHMRRILGPLFASDHPVANRRAPRRRKSRYRGDHDCVFVDRRKLHPRQSQGWQLEEESR